MTKRRLLYLAAALGVAAAGALLGGALRGGSSSAAAPLPGVRDAERFQGGFASGQDTVSIVLRLQSELRANGSDAHSYALLGLAYQQRARETGDPSYYTKSEGALRRSLTLGGDELLATSALGSLAAARHRFAEALALGRRAQRLSPGTARNYGVIGDALVELGRYPAAFRAFDAQARLKPSLSSYARVSYARELRGDRPAAVEAMRLAVDAATGEREPLAWTHVQLGKLYWNRGEVRAAAREYEEALRIFPAYPYALDALALAEAALGRMPRALALQRRAVESIPLPQYVGQLADLLAAAGKPALARRQYALIGAIERLLAANGVKSDLEIALFDVDHGIRLPHALARARIAQRARPSIDGDDVLAWALARNGRCAEARPWSQRSLRLGTRDALKFFHRGWIERCLGNEEAARAWFRRALAANPRFSLLWAPVARKALS